MRRVSLCLVPFLCIAAAPAGGDDLAAQDARVNSVAFRIATKNTARCSAQAPLTGIMVHSLAQYGPAERPIVARAFSLGLHPGVLAVAKGSPAERAGLKPGDQVIAVDGAAQTVRLTPKPSMDAVIATRRAIDRALSNGGTVRFTVKSGAAASRDVMVAAAKGCAALVEQVPSPKYFAEAYAGVVTVSSAVVTFTRSDDELAFVIAHEMAHLILGHPARLDKIGRKRSNILATEIEADKFAVRLMAGAGYDLNAAPAFWARYGDRTGYGIFSDGTHLRTKARVQLLRDEIARVSAERTAQ
jgi:beta-barrel assembly-enhancing protease